MDSGLYAAYNGLLTRTQALDTAANNLANAGTSGFRAQRDYFRSVLGGWSGEHGGRLVAGRAGGKPVRPAEWDGAGYGAGRACHDGQSSGPGDRRGRLLCGEDGARRAVYAGRGVYAIDGRGPRDAAGGSRCWTPTASPITVPTGSVVVSGDGTISTSTDAGSAIAGRVGVFTFADSSALHAEGTNRFVADAGGGGAGGDRGGPPGSARRGPARMRCTGRCR